MFSAGSTEKRSQTEQGHPQFHHVHGAGSPYSRPSTPVRVGLPGSIERVHRSFDPARSDPGQGRPTLASCGRGLTRYGPGRGSRSSGGRIRIDAGGNRDPRHSSGGTPHPARAGLRRAGLTPPDCAAESPRPPPEAGRRPVAAYADRMTSSDDLSRTAYERWPAQYEAHRSSAVIQFPHQERRR